MTSHATQTFLNFNVFNLIFLLLFFTIIFLILCFCLKVT